MLFADDSFLLMKANRQNAECVKGILDRYCANSRQRLGQAKSSIFFLENSNVEMKAKVCEILNILTESLTDKYLGLLALIGADRSDCFHHLIDRVQARTLGWEEKLLSMGGKEVLIKSIA